MLACVCNVYCFLPCCCLCAAHTRSPELHDEAHCMTVVSHLFSSASVHGRHFIWVSLPYFVFLVFVCGWAANSAADVTTPVRFHPWPVQVGNLTSGVATASIAPGPTGTQKFICLSLQAPDRRGWTEVHLSVLLQLLIIQRLRFQIFEHYPIQPFSLYYHVFRPLKDTSMGNKKKNKFSDGIKKLVKQCEKWIEKEGDEVEINDISFGSLIGLHIYEIFNLLFFF